ncbi:helix-turn-helix transcriptional regulator [Streptomyces sp. NPDC059894]|uniref:helix-turn-helix transcriptional regulator n=1 Tax=unclassified Streptomyces TaxID=2593676 RepID=UPI00365138B4
MGMYHNAELGDFLRSRRSRLRPEDAGLPPGVSAGTRRVPGLRREEVALLAGVSADYYTRLEQGRHPQVSEAVLDAVARALRLDDVERGYLRDLTRATSGSRRGRATDATRAPRVRAAVHQMLDGLGDFSPALVVNHRGDVLAANRLARALITDFDVLAHHERNLTRFVLLDPAARKLYRDWEDVAQVFVAKLRLAAGSHPDDRRLNELVGEFCIRVPESGAWWDSHRVQQCAHGEQRFAHPVVGDLTLHHETLALPADADQEICLYTAEPGSTHAETLRLLASWTAPTTAPTVAERTSPADDHPAPHQHP